MDKYPKRKQNRSTNYDYSNNGYYYVTICTDNRVEWLGNIANGQMAINPYGIICQQCWLDLPNYYNIFLDSYIIMPNHFHGVLIIDNSNKREGYKPSPTDKLYSLSEIICGFKTFSSKQINKTIKINNKFKWQRSFHDHIIRNDKSLNNIREYIINNPAA
ncbi:MAG: transposase, partial [Candidatus Omnitrophota bacterium]